MIHKIFGLFTVSFLEIEQLKSYVPVTRKKASKEHYGKVKNYVDADQDETIKQHRKLYELQ